jgi:hypothetical protein
VGVVVSAEPRRECSLERQPPAASPFSTATPASRSLTTVRRVAASSPDAVELSSVSPQRFPSGFHRRDVTATETVRAYYDALRDGRSLGVYFADGEPTMKHGISERLVGLETVEAGLRTQTETTSDWTVESRELRVTERARCAWFSDEVRMAWTTTGTGVRHGYETRWSGTLERAGGRGDDGSGAPPDDAWRFVAMHVSVAHPLEGEG